MEYSLQISNLTKKYKDFCLDHINLTLKPGCIMGFIGENGAGKSTTIKAIMNVIKKDEGSVKILDQEMDHRKNALRIKQQVGVVFDDCHFNDTLNVKSINVFMSKIYQNWDEKLFYHYVSIFHLPKDKVVKEFSRGMTMKLSIAAALAHKPKLLLLDEATSGLDPIIRNELLDVFLEYIQDEEHSILLSSHITSDLEKISDYVGFIHNGNMIFCDSKDDIIHNHRIIKCGLSDFEQIDKSSIIGVRKSKFQCEVLVKQKDLVQKKYNNLTVDNASLEDIMLFYARGDKQ